MRNNRIAVIVVILAIVTAVNVFPKNIKEDKNNSEQAGHADDIAKLLTGNGFYANMGNRRLFTTIEGLANLMYLVVDSTMKMETEKEADEVPNAFLFLHVNMKQLNIASIPNFNEFLTPAGNSHGHYTHLGWDHVYPDDDIYTTSRGDRVVNTQKRWKIRKKILTDAMGKIFKFSNRTKQDSLGALFYYVHILGDHEDNSITTAYTRIPIERMDEQISDESWETGPQKEKWIPSTTIIKELKKHLPILFADQAKSPNALYYKNLMHGLDDIMPEDQIKKARYVLYLLNQNVPSLMKEAPFAKDFYRDYQIKVNIIIPLPN